MKHPTVGFDLELEINPELDLLTIVEKVILKDQHYIVAALGVADPLEDLVGPS
jgi:hypothetical protein